MNFENYFSKFEEDELKHLTLKDILTFDLEELETIKNKIMELKEISVKLNDKELISFLDNRISVI